MRKFDPLLTPSIATEPYHNIPYSPHPMATLGPYTLTGKTLFEGNGCEILEAIYTRGVDGHAATTSIAGRGIEVTHHDGTLWAIKIKNDNHYDIRYLEKLKGVRNCVEVPADSAAFTGRLPDGRTWYRCSPTDASGHLLESSSIAIAPQVDTKQYPPGTQWYAMRKYDDTVDNRTAFSRSRWQQIAWDVLQFLQDTHALRLAHLDIKTFNILYDATHNCFRVCDFEHMTEADDFDDDPLHTYDAEHAWYYAMLGGDLSKPYESYRMDLEALGFVLSMLTWPAGKPIRFLREYECRMREEMTILTVEETLEMRKREIAAGAPPALNAYYAAIQEVAWDTEESPPPEFYERLRGLFVE